MILSILVLIATSDPSSAVPWVAPILQFGVGGGVLVWFMLSCTPRLKAIESSMDRMAKSVLLLIVSMPTPTEAGKQQARVLIGEIEEAEKDRSK